MRLKKRGLDNPTDRPNGSRRVTCVWVNRGLFVGFSGLGLCQGPLECAQCPPFPVMVLLPTRSASLHRHGYPAQPWKAFGSIGPE